MLVVNRQGLPFLAVWAVSVARSLRPQFLLFGQRTNHEVQDEVDQLVCARIAEDGRVLNDLLDSSTWHAFACLQGG